MEGKVRRVRRVRGSPARSPTDEDAKVKKLLTEVIGFAVLDGLSTTFLDRTAVALVRVRRLTLRNPHRSASTIRRKAEWLQWPTSCRLRAMRSKWMAVLRPNLRPKREPGGEELKKRFPMLRVKVYDAETKTSEEIQLSRS